MVLSDIWGVVHDGKWAYAEACDALARFRAGGGTVLLLSNSPAPSPVVMTILADKGVRRDCWDAIVSSGDITLAHVAARGWTRVHHLGPDRDLPLLDAMTAVRVPLESAEAIVCTGLVDDRSETAETYRPVLAQALARRLPLVCANPDLIVDVGGEMLQCAGVVAALYEQMGGAVTWAGKPHGIAYEMALDRVAQLRAGAVRRQRILAIGDAIRTDIAGAIDAGLDALFIGQGIHRQEVMPAGAIDASALVRLLDGQRRLPVAAMTALAW